MLDVPNNRRNILLHYLNELRLIVTAARTAPERDLHHYERAARELERVAGETFEREQQLVEALEAILVELRGRVGPTMPEA